MAGGGNKSSTAKRKRIESPVASTGTASKRPVLAVTTISNVPVRPPPQENSNIPRQSIEAPLTDADKLAQFEKMRMEAEQLRADNEQLNQERERLVQEGLHAATQIRDLRKTVVAQRAIESRRPIRKPILSKAGRKDNRLTSPRELLGLDLTKDDYERVGKLNARGILKDSCWKHLLTCSRDTITWGTNEKLLGVLPDWQHTPMETKEKLLDQFDQSIREIPCLKALFHHGDIFDSSEESEIWENSWPLCEMLKATIDGIKGTDKRQKDMREWLEWVMMEERPADEQEDNTPEDVGDWPPPRAKHLATTIVHRRMNGTESSDREDEQEEDDATQEPLSRHHREPNVTTSNPDLTLADAFAAGGAEEVDDMIGS